MPRSRSNSLGEGLKEPHLINLKVLRLSRPTFHQQYPLPHAEPQSFPEVEVDALYRASLSYPSQGATQFPLSPLVTLPPSFGNAYIGETFSCILSANNNSKHNLTAVRITADIQTPSSTAPLNVLDDNTEPASIDLAPGRSTQRIARYDLKEEGAYVLAVQVTYTDGGLGDGDAPDADTGRTRTFRKLYQFVVQQCLTVRTKSGKLQDGAVLEAQLENMGEQPITLRGVRMLGRAGWKSEPFSSCGGQLIRSREVVQVGFRLWWEDQKIALVPTLGQLEIEWRTAGGGKGVLTTGTLQIKSR